MKFFVSNMLREFKLKLGMLLCVALVGTTQVSAATYAQNTKVSLDLRQQSVEQVFEAIKNQTEYKFFYNDTQLDMNRKVTVDVKNETVDIVLDQVLKGTNFTYEIYEKQIIIKQIPKQKVKQEKVKLKGTVTDENGEPVPFASVCFKGTTHGCVAALDGKFELEMLEDANAFLVVSCIGYTTVELPIGDKREFTVQLQSSTEGLEEVVVTGYQTISKERATGSFGKIDNKDIEATINTDVTSQLEGRVQGLLVHDGKISIRGISSINAEQEPLVVVDNFPLNSMAEMDNLNPDDVQSVTVLKDAAAASIWGVRAANGVIVITTKGGERTKEGMGVEISAKLSFDNMQDLSELRLANSSQIIDLEKEAILEKGWQNFTLPEYDINNFDSRSKSYSKAQAIILAHQRNAVDPNNLTASEMAALDGELAPLRGYDFQKQYKKHLLQNRVKQSYNIALSGNTEKSSYRFSILYDDYKSAKVGDENKKLTLSLKNNYKLSDKVKVNYNAIAYYKKDEANSSSLELGLMKPYERIYDENGNKVAINNDIPEHHKTHYSAGYLPWDEYVIDELDDQDNKTKELYIRATVGLNYQIKDWLSFETSFVGSATNTKISNLQEKGSYHERFLVNKFTTPSGSKFPRGGILNDNHTNRYYWAFRNQLNFNKEVFGDHRINVIFGTEINAQIYDSKMYHKIGYDSQTLYNEDAVNWKDFRFTDTYSGTLGAYALNNTEMYDEDRFASIYTNIGYSIADKYSFTLSARQDKSNLFGSSPEYSKNALWSTGASWQIYKEDFFSSELFNRLTARFTYGVNGNIDKSTSPVMTISSGNSFFTGEKTSHILNPPNKLLRWERVKVWNAGVDFAILNNRISGSVDAYYKKSVDLLGVAALDYTYGFSSAMLNNASMNNKGFDLHLDVIPVKGDITWDFSLNFGCNKNEVTKVELAENSAASYIGTSPIKGESLHRLFSYKWAGLNNQGQAQIYDLNGNKVNYMTAVTDPAALKYEGVTVPKIFGGSLQRVNYKNWTATLNFNYAFGHKMRMPYANLGGAFYGNADKLIAKRWRKEGDVTDVPGLPNTIAEAQNSYRTSIYKNSSLLVDNASYIKLRSLGLSYTFNKIKNVESLVIMLQANNLWMWTANKENIDSTVGYGVIPNPTNYSVSIKTRF